MTETTIKKYIPFGEPIKPETAQGGFGFIPNGIREKNIFFYHPDHLGSSSYITGNDGKVSQHTEYIAFGEILFDEHNTEHTMPYLFNGKELDQETNLTYFGARYLDMKTSLWLNTDPLSGYNPTFEHEHYIDGQHNGGIFNPMNLNTYGYTYNNPIIYIDPNGKQNYFTSAPTFKYDSGFSKFPKQTPNGTDRINFFKWTLKATLARAVLPNGAAAYMHYLGNTGKDFKFNLSEYLNKDKSGKTLLRNIVNIAKIEAETVLTKGGKVSYYSRGFSTGFHSNAFPYPDTEDWQKAVGAFNFYYKADLSVKDTGDSLKYSLDLTLHAEDKYNFNPGQKDIATGTPDSENGRFEVIGWAKEFMQKGEAKIKTIEWKVSKEKE